MRKGLGTEILRLPRKSRCGAMLICNSSLRPRNAHEQQTPLFFELVGLTPAPLVGQKSLFHGHDVDDGKLQPLRGVQGHQRDAVDVGLPIVGVVDQAGLLQKRLQAAGRVRSSNSRATVSNSSDVGQPLVVFRSSGRFQLLLVAGLGQHVAENLFERAAGDGRQAVEEGDELRARARRVRAAIDFDAADAGGRRPAAAGRGASRRRPGGRSSSCRCRGAAC